MYLPSVRRLSELICGIPMKKSMMLLRRRISTLASDLL